MKVKCRKCEIVWEMNGLTFDDIKYIQSLECGVLGLHSLIGVND